MEKEKAKYIDRIEIKGLWERFNVNWDLHSDVNILVGENGTGKSTILQIMFKAVEECSDGLKNQNIIDYRDAHHQSKILFKPAFIAPFNAKNNGIERDSTNILIPKIDFIQTFDAFLKITDLDRFYNKGLYTPLDYDLNEVINTFVSYQLDQTKKIINQKINTTTAFAKMRYFMDTVNRLFINTGKVVDENDNRIVFLIGNEVQIEPNQLSSGEKQLLLILLTVLCQDEKPTILLMDEPEISLHLNWQDELIEIIRTLNPNCQVIIATHSPSLFSDGWNDRVFWMEDICKPIQELEKV